MKFKNIEKLYAELCNKDSLFLFNKNFNELSWKERITLLEYKHDKQHPKWKKIEIDNLRYEYEISNTGVIRYIKNPKKNDIYLYKEGYAENTGYCRVTLRCLNQINITKLIHRLVAYAFIPNDDPLDKTQVNHINGNKQCNWVGNLEWVSPKENNQHAIRTGLYNPYINQLSGRKLHGVDTVMCNHTEEQVRKACELLEQNCFTQSEIAKQLGVDRSFIHSLKSGSWRHITKDYNIPQTDTIKDRDIRTRIRKLIRAGKSIDDMIKAFDYYPNFIDDWNEYIIEQQKKLSNEK